MTPAEFIQHHYSVEGMEVAAAGTSSLRVTTPNQVFDIGSFSSQMLEEFDASVDAQITQTGQLELVVNWKKKDEEALKGPEAGVSLVPVVLGTVLGTLGSVGLGRAVFLYYNVTSLGV